MFEKEDFYIFLDSIRHFAHLKAIADGAGFPEKALTKHYAWREGKRGYPFPPKHFEALVKWMCKDGHAYQIGSVLYVLFNDELRGVEYMYL